MARRSKITKQTQMGVGGALTNRNRPLPGRAALDPASPATNDTQPTQAQPAQSQPAQSQPAQPPQGGWRRVKPGEQP